MPPCVGCCGFLWAQSDLGVMVKHPLLERLAMLPLSMKLPHCKTMKSIVWMFPFILSTNCLYFCFFMTTHQQKMLALIKDWLLAALGSFSSNMLHVVVDLKLYLPHIDLIIMFLVFFICDKKTPQNKPLSSFLVNKTTHISMPVTFMSHCCHTAVFLSYLNFISWIVVVWV